MRFYIQFIVVRQRTFHAFVQPVHLHQFLGTVDHGLRRVQYMPLRVQVFREDAQVILVQHLFHQVQQL